MTEMKHFIHQNACFAVIETESSHLDMFRYDRTRVRREELNSDANYCTDKKVVEHAKGLRFAMYCKAMSMILLIYKFGLRLRAFVTK